MWEVVCGTRPLCSQMKARSQEVLEIHLRPRVQQAGASQKLGSTWEHTFCYLCLLILYYYSFFDSGQGACTACPDHETTTFRSAKSVAACDCEPGYFRLNTSQESGSG